MRIIISQRVRQFGPSLGQKTLIQPRRQISSVHCDLIVYGFVVLLKQLNPRVLVENSQIVDINNSDTPARKLDDSKVSLTNIHKVKV